MIRRTSSPVRLVSPLEGSQAAWNGRPISPKKPQPESPASETEEASHPGFPLRGGGRKGVAHPVLMLSLASLSLLALPATVQAQSQLVSPQKAPSIPSTERLRLDAQLTTAARQLRLAEQQGTHTPPSDFQEPTDWALAQVGITESQHPEVVQGYSQGRKEPWCAHFVSTALEKTTGSPWGHDSTVAGILKWGKAHKGHFITTAQATANPNLLQPGDLAIWKEPGKYSHVGFVIEVSPQGYRTVEGNAPPSLFYPDGDDSQGVRLKTYSFQDDQLTGFVRPHGEFACPPTL